MFQKIKIRSLVALFLFGSSCSYDINTVDPQSSTSIANSKRDGMYVCEYSPEGGLVTISSVKEAWVEHVWYNQVSVGNRKKRRIDEVQLNLNLGDFKDSSLRRDEYLVNWLMKDDMDRVLGMSNGLYVLSLDKRQIPETIRVSVCKIGQNREATYVFQFRLKKN